MSSKHSRSIREKYVGYYIEVPSQEQIDGYIEIKIKYPTIEYLAEQLEKDNAYVVLRKMHFDWIVSENPEWCIWKVFMNRDALLEHCYNCEQINDRIYAINITKEIHLG